MYQEIKEDIGALRRHMKSYKQSMISEKHT